MQTSKDPDLILLVETDQWWADMMKPLSQSHPISYWYPLKILMGCYFLQIRARGCRPQANQADLVLAEEKINKPSDNTRLSI